MLALISPAKTLDFDSPLDKNQHSKNIFLKQSQELIDQLRTKSAADIATLMKLSDKLAQVNFDRYRDWSSISNSEQRAAIFAFKGDVYTGLDASSLSTNEIDTAQNSLGILSGLYGLLKPLDLIMPYRLEMGTRLTGSWGKNLYEFWGSQITSAINKQLEEGNHSHLVNLASQEYFKAVKSKNISKPIVNCDFLDWKNDKYKIISFYAKKARGLYARFLIESQATSLDDLKKFSSQGYQYCAEESSELKLVFKRKLES